jgi:hypothetical protein
MTRFRGTTSRGREQAKQVAAGAEDQPAAKTDEDQVEQTKGHGRSSCPRLALAHRGRSQAGQAFGTPQDEDQIEETEGHS